MQESKQRVQDLNQAIRSHDRYMMALVTRSLHDGVRYMKRLAFRYMIVA